MRLPASGRVVREGVTVFKLLHLALQKPFIFVFSMFPGGKTSNGLEFQEERTNLQMQKDTGAVQQLTWGGCTMSTERLAMSD